MKSFVRIWYLRVQLSCCNSRFAVNQTSNVSSLSKMEHRTRCKMFTTLNSSTFLK